jgi:hypothetical protein
MSPFGINIGELLDGTRPVQPQAPPKRYTPHEYCGLCQKVCYTEEAGRRKIRGMHKNLGTQTWLYRCALGHWHIGTRRR